jgi:hypothetical protein
LNLLRGIHAKQQLKTNSVRYSLLASCVTLAACAGGSSGGSSPRPATPTAADIYERDASLLIDSFRPFEFTELATIPGDSRVNYEGFALAQLSNTEDDVMDSFAGNLLLVVDFDEVEMVSGSIYEIVDDKGEAMSGEILLEGGQLNRNGDPNADATFDFQGSGELTSESYGAVDFQLGFEGDFLGQNANGIGGDILGIATHNGESQAVGGLFIVQIETPSED